MLQLVNENSRERCKAVSNGHESTLQFYRSRMWSEDNLDRIKGCRKFALHACLSNQRQLTVASRPTCMEHVIQGTAINRFKGQGTQSLSFDNIRKGSVYQKAPLHENYTQSSVMQTSFVPIEGCTAALRLRSSRS
jgi:hypothetical protein